MSLQRCLSDIDESIARVLPAVPGDVALSEWMHRYANDHCRRLAEDLWLIRQHASPGASILEFGSSPFFLTDALARSEYRVIGLDIDPQRFSKIVAQCNLDVRSVNFETEPVPFDDRTFDVVLFNETFEHLRIDLISTMAEVRRVLKGDGTLWLSTPNHRSLIGLWTLLWHHRGCCVCPDLYQEYEKLKLFGHMGHVREYTAREISDFLLRIGLRTRRTLFRYYRPRTRTSFGLRIRDAIERAVGTALPSLRSFYTLECERCEPTPGKSPSNASGAT